MKSRKNLVGALLLILLIVAMFFLYKATAPKTNDSEKRVSVTVIHLDKSRKEFNYRTNAKFLGDLLKKEKLVKGEKGQYGLFITTVDGEKADDSKKQFWSISKKGKSVNTGVDSTPLADGDRFELTLTTY
ncbi:hypothetical protein lbkm_0484 [Lachnospiraceae bacterium KM106-2]|nr:hypothetical protein lbkm_0484 [Lachnospiraceae bacterium KM106-2]